MRKSLITAGLAALILAAGSVPAMAGTQDGWRVTYVSPEGGYDGFGLYDVTATGPHDAWAVGSRQQGAGASGALLHWNGANWSDVTIPGSTGSFMEVGGSSPKNVWVAGVTANGAQRTWHWDGTSWTATSLGAYSVADIAVLGPKNVWLVGNDNEGGTGPGTALHWNGTQWKSVTMPFTARRIAAVSAHDVWAVGENSDQPLAEHWDGTSWTSAPLPEVPIPDGENGFSYFNDIVADGSGVWAVGRLYWGGGEELRPAEEHNQPVIMHWDGQQWSLRLGSENDIAMSVSPDGEGGIWYATINKSLVHLAADGTTTTAPVATPDGHESPEIQHLAGVPGGTTVFGVGTAAPDASDDQSWDAVVEQYH